MGHLPWRVPQEEKGILVVADGSYEWFLSWWYENLRKFCDLPILFVDFGMTEEAKKWCKERGYYYSVEHLKPKVEKLRSSDFTDLVLWGRNKGASTDFHIKPFAMMSTVFKFTLFLDIDCEVKAPLNEMFSLVEKHSFCCAKDSYQVKDFKPVMKDLLFKERLLHLEQTMYNSGVLVYSHESEIVSKWAQMTLERGPSFCGDQEVLSYVIHQNKFSLHQLGEKWNCKKHFKDSEKACIVHWVGDNKIELLQELYPTKKHPFKNKF